MATMNFCNQDVVVKNYFVPTHTGTLQSALSLLPLDYYLLLGHLTSHRIRDAYKGKVINWAQNDSHGTDRTDIHIPVPKEDLIHGQ